jgi:SAM-dependent methyltransferase
MPQNHKSHAEYINELMRGYWKAAILFCANDLGIFEALADEPKTADQVAQRLGTDPRATAMLMNALAALKLLEKNGDLFSNSETANQCLVPSAPYHMANLIRHSRNCWWSWGDLSYVVRHGKPRHPATLPTPPDEAQRTRAFILGMHDTASFTADLMMDRLDLSRVRRMLDVGGGPGTYCYAAAKRNKELHATIFDLPTTLEITKELIKKYGFEDRITTLAGDFTVDELPKGYDLVLMSQILHSYPPDQCEKLVKSGADSLVSGGTLVIHEFALEENRIEPLEAALFSVNMLVNTDGGAAYTKSEILGWMQSAGLQNLTVEQITPRSAMFTGQKP